MTLIEYIKDFFKKAYDESTRIGYGKYAILIFCFGCSIAGNIALQWFGWTMIIIFILALRWGYDRP